MRDYWRGYANCGELARRLSGSADLYEADGRDPFASINFITAHDGFTLHDLVTYEHKHNESNLEDSQDGTDDNRSWNCGVEGESDDPEVGALRDRQQRNFLTTLLISQGTPMVLGGDELDRTQHGNNNAWCQDNEISWYDWNPSPRSEQLREFTRRLIRLRREHPVFRQETFLRGEEGERTGLPDVWWFRADGRKMTRRDWNDGERVLGMFLNGEEIGTIGHRGEEIEDDSFIVLVNAHHEDRAFMLPRRRFGAQWTLELSTADPAAQPGSAGHGARTEIEVSSRSIVILKRVA
jgi:glycogen operon protein